MTAIYALIPAAGRAVRFSRGGAGGNKVFAPLGGKPLLYWTAQAFASHGDVDGIVVVAGPEEVTQCREALMGVDKVLAVVAGGETRQASVAIGLFALGGDPDDFILIHDAARPLVTADVIDRCIAGVRQRSGKEQGELKRGDVRKGSRLVSINLYLPNIYRSK